MGGLKPSRKVRTEDRQKEARERQEAYNLLTLEQKLQLLDNNDLVATKQRAKITKQMQLERNGQKKKTNK